MGLAIVEIAEFTGTIEEADEDTSSTYLVAINGEYRTSYGSPSYEFPSDNLLEEYKICSYVVGNARNWSQFYSLCTDIVEDENIFTNKLPREVIRENVNSYISGLKLDKKYDNVEDISEKDMQSIIEDIVST
ncbi:hypothetical protein [Salinibacter sp.]|uniref:hypothetical protein n=1 Tax=Salinibacter sp. TaxID=2065818 RepID=UPI0021E97B08|nr:hypothetical protein [Salinibacter sp.]